MKTQHTERRTDKRDVARVFRLRLAELAARAGENMAQLAAGIGLDRSATSQILSGRTTRLPRAETLIRVAQRHGVSLDWLMGLSEDEALTASLASALEIEEAAMAGDDPLLGRWHAEAAGSKVRYVPSALPDLLRTDEVIALETARTGIALQTGAAEARQRLSVSRSGATDMEVCMPQQALAHFARGEGIWHDVSPSVRRRQLAHMADTADDLYPSLRVHLFDGAATYSAPFTVFGTRRAAVYIGEAYLVLNASEAIAAFTRRFDLLVRRAVIHPHQVPGHCRALAAEIAG